MDDYAALLPWRIDLSAVCVAPTSPPPGLQGRGSLIAAVMSLIHSAKLNGHDPSAYLRDVLERLPTQAASRIAELLPHCWSPSA